MRQVAGQVVRRLATRIGHGDLHVDLGAPGGNLVGLALHFVELVGEHLERNRPVGNRIQHHSREALVVGHACLPHERGIGRESLDIRPAVHLEHARQIRSIGKDLDRQLFN